MALGSEARQPQEEDGDDVRGKQIEEMRVREGGIKSKQGGREQEGAGHSVSACDLQSPWDISHDDACASQRIPRLSFLQPASSFLQQVFTERRAWQLASKI